MGVVFNVANAIHGYVGVLNIDARIGELRDELDLILGQGKISSKSAQRLRGRMQFADAQIFGKTGKRCLKTLTDFAEGTRWKFTEKDAFFHKLFRDLLVRAEPRAIRALPLQNSLVFTDACYERDDKFWPCGIGGVLFDGSTTGFFSVSLDEEARRILGEASKKQIIFEAETLASAVALVVWKSFLEHKHCLLFVDSEGAKFVLIKGVADNQIVDCIAEYFAEVESSLNSCLWICRVPSKSNVADEPSRGVPVKIPLDNAIDFSEAAKIAMWEILRIWEKGRRPRTSP